MTWVRLTNDQGNNTSLDKEDLAQGELQQSTGLYYKKGNPKDLFTIGGQTTFGDTGSGAKVQGVAIAQYDSATNKVVALSGATFYEATAGATGTFTSGKGGLNASATHLASVHAQDRWYYGNGYDRNWVRESDGTYRNMGMTAPVAKIAATVSDSSGTTTTSRPTAEIGSGDFDNDANAYDADTDTYASVSTSTAGTSTATYGTWGANTDSNRVLYVKWALAGMQDTQAPGLDPGFDFGSGGTVTTDFNVTVKIEKSENSGSSWTTILQQTTESALNDRTVQSAVSANSNAVRVRVTLTYNSGTAQATMRVYDIRITDGSATATFSTTTGVYYTYTEYDETRGLESAQGPNTELITFSTQNQASLSLPSSTQNTTTTHWRVYRTFDGGSAPQDYGLIGQIKSSETTFIDDFTTDKDTTASPLLSLVRVDKDGTNFYFARDVVPPSAIHFNPYQGSLLITSRTQPRALYMSEPGRPESVPEINVVEKFMFPQNDLIQGTMTVGDVAIIVFKGLAARLSGLPTVVSGVFNASITELRGQPGCPSRYGFTSYSVGGEPRGAWVSYHGIHITNGFTVRRITDDIDWDSTVNVANLSSSVLHWDESRECLVFAYDSDGGGTNDKYLLLHMNQEKGNGSPKITGPHTGAFNHLASAVVGGTHRLYSAHVSDGKVYLEDGSGSAGFTLLYRRTADFNSDTNVLALRVAHTDFGANEVATLTLESGDYDPDRSNTITNSSFSLAGRGHDGMFINQAAEWHELKLVYAGTQAGSVRYSAFDVLRQGQAGEEIAL